MNTEKKGNRSLVQKYPTLFAGMVVLAISTVLLGGREMISNAAPNESQSQQKTETTIQDEVQYVTSTLSGWQYEPITVQQGIPVKWTLDVPSRSLNGCNNAITIPAYNLTVNLKEGENLIEFTPEESGTFVFSCWMGMIRSSITVVSESGTVANNVNDGSSALPAGCCR